MANNLRVINASIKDSTFTSELFGTFNVTAATAWAKKFGIKTISIIAEVRENLEEILSDIDLDQIRLDELRNQLTSGLAFEPILMIELENETSFIIDGHHRIKIALEKGFPSMIGYLIPKQFVGQFKVKFIVDDKELSNKELLDLTFGKHNNIDGKPREQNS